MSRSQRILRCKHAWIFSVILRFEDFFLSEDISITVCNVSQYHISTANDGIHHHFPLPKILLDMSKKYIEKNIRDLDKSTNPRFAEGKEICVMLLR